MDYQKLNNGCVVVGRTGRAGRTGVEWDSFREYTLYIQKNQKGQVCVLALQDCNFAEFDPRICAEGDLLIVEDYYFEVKSVVRNG